MEGATPVEPAAAEEPATAVELVAVEEPATTSPDMVLPAVDMALLGEIVELGFDEVRARKALMSGCDSVEDACEWVVEHDDDADIDAPIPLVPRPTGAAAGEGALAREEEEVAPLAGEAVPQAPEEPPLLGDPEDPMVGLPLLTAGSASISERSEGTPGASASSPGSLPQIGPASPSSSAPAPAPAAPAPAASAPAASSDLPRLPPIGSPLVASSSSSSSSPPPSVVAASPPTSPLSGGSEGEADDEVLPPVDEALMAGILNFGFPEVRF